MFCLYSPIPDNGQRLLRVFFRNPGAPRSFSARSPEKKCTACRRQVTSVHAVQSSGVSGETAFLSGRGGDPVHCKSTRDLHSLTSFDDEVRSVFPNVLPPRPALTMMLIASVDCIHFFGESVKAFSPASLRNPLEFEGVKNSGYRAVLKHRETPPYSCCEIGSRRHHSGSRCFFPRYIRKADGKVRILQCAVFFILPNPLIAFRFRAPLRNTSCGASRRLRVKGIPNERPLTTERRADFGQTQSECAASVLK